MSKLDNLKSLLKDDAEDLVQGERDYIGVITMTGDLSTVTDEQLRDYERVIDEATDDACCEEEAVDLRYESSMNWLIENNFATLDK